MKRVDRVAESEATFTVGTREWTLDGWKADVAFWALFVPCLFVFGVGLATVIGWFA